MEVIYSQEEFQSLIDNMVRQIKAATDAMTPAMRKLTLGLFVSVTQSQALVAQRSSEMAEAALTRIKNEMSERMEPWQDQPHVGIIESTIGIAEMTLGTLVRFNELLGKRIQEIADSQV